MGHTSPSSIIFQYLGHQFLQHRYYDKIEHCITDTLQVLSFAQFLESMEFRPSRARKWNLIYNKISPEQYIAYLYSPAALAEHLGYNEIANFLRAKQIQKRL